MKRHVLIQAGIKRVFEESVEECKNYGFENVQTQFWAAENIIHFATSVRQNNGFLDQETEDDNLIIIDDTWLKLAQLMWTRFRKTGRTARASLFAENDGYGWAAMAMEHIKHRKFVFTRAGELICYMGNLSSDPIMYFRDGEAPTILDLLDSAQVFIPAPVLSNVNNSKIVESLREDKAKTAAILAELMEGSHNAMKDFE